MGLSGRSKAATDTWILSETRGLEARIALLSIAAELILAEVYAKVDFDKTHVPPADERHA